MRLKFFTIPAILFSLIFKSQTSSLPPKPVVDEYFGNKVIDEFRNIENLNSKEVLSWMKEQSDFTNSVLQNIPQRSYYADKKKELDALEGYSVYGLKLTGNGKYFYFKKEIADKTEKIYYKKSSTSEEVLLFDPADYKKSGKYSVNLISPSWDGEKLAISIAENGKELSEVIIMDVKSKKIYPDAITQTNPSSLGGIKWLQDNSGFFYVRYPVSDIKSQQFGRNTEVRLYKINEKADQSKHVFSNLNNPELKIGDDKYPAVLTFDPDDLYYIGIIMDSDSNRETFIIKKEDLLKGKKNWKALYKKEDKVYYVRPIGREIIFLSGYNSPNFKLCKTEADHPDFKNAEILIPEKKDEVFKSFVITKEGIFYTTTKNGVEAKLYLWKDGNETEIRLPAISGRIDLEAKGKDFSDLWIYCSGWTNDYKRLKFDHRTHTFKTDDLSPVTDYQDFKNIVAKEIVVKARDGEEIPVSLLYDKSTVKSGNIPTLIYSYGAYGYSQSPFFGKSFLLWAKQGGLVAFAHVRGGGEKGKDWHLAGQKGKKPNTWRDVIDCAEYLIKEGYTSKDKMAVWGTSAGGITAGRAITDRPDLFKAAVVEVGMTNMLRFEKTPNGAANIAEFGSSETEDGFKNLLEMDAYHHIENGKKYPATLVTGGMNDNRVIVWQPAKFAAKLMADNASENPILLKINYEGGHGSINITDEQRNSELSDMFAFLFWQLGHPDYQPKKK